MDRPPVEIGGRYRVIRRIGGGSFGDIYLGISLRSSDEVAIKLENTNNNYSQLSNEYQVYRILRDAIGFPSIRYYGHEKNYNALVMDLLGPSLEDLFNSCGRHFTMKTIVMIFEQTFCRLYFLHSKDFIHRDVKPENFLIGNGPHRNKLFLIDFGLAKRFRNRGLDLHIRYREDQHLTGTARYASINAHLGMEQSRRDDMESLGYVMMYFNRGSLPWQDMKASSKKQKHEKVSEKKMSTPIEELCKGFPAEFTIYLNYCRDLGFAERPSYSFLGQLIKTLFHSLDLKNTFGFDWIPKKKAVQSGGTDTALPPGSTENRTDRDKESEKQQSEMK